MKHPADGAGNPADLAPLTALLVAYAPVASRPWHRLIWTLDQRLAAIVRRAGEPTIAAIRLAWWDAVLVECDPTKGRGEPLVETWRATAPEGAAPLAGQLIDGWRALLGSEAPAAADVAAFGEKRGGGLFSLIAGREDEALARAGAVWALWDLAGHASEPALAEMAIGQAREAARDDPVPLRRAEAPRPLRLLHALARADALAGRVPRGFERRHYVSLLWRSLLP